MTSACLAIATTMSAQVSGLRQAMRNASDGISLVQVAEGSLNESSNLLVRMKELAVQAASDTVGEVERSMINLEFQETLKEIDRIAEVTLYNGVKLLNGEAKTFTNSKLELMVVKLIQLSMMLEI